jgi:hypothetical protein
MKNKGYSHSEKALDGGDWEIVFTPAPAASQPAAAAASKPGQDDATGWPEPRHKLDNRGLMPPEPMVFTMEAVEGMSSGESARVPVRPRAAAALPELQSRGHFAHCDKLGPSSTGS